MKITKEAIRTIVSNGYEVGIRAELASDDEDRERLNQFMGMNVPASPYVGMTRLHAEGSSNMPAAQYLFMTSDFMNTVSENDVEEFVSKVETQAAHYADESIANLSQMHPDERRLAELMSRQSEWGVGSREAYEAGCEFAGVEAHSDDEILRGSYGIRYADYYMSHYGDRRWKLVMGQNLASARLRVIEAPRQEDPTDDMLNYGMDDVALLSRDLRANPYNE